MYSAALPRQFCKRPLPSVTTGLCWAGGRARHPPSSAVSRSFATKSSLASAAAAVARLGKLQRPGPGWPVAYIAPVCGECEQEQEEVPRVSTMARQVSRCLVSSLVVVLVTQCTVAAGGLSSPRGRGQTNDFCRLLPSPATSRARSMFSPAD